MAKKRPFLDMSRVSTKRNSTFYSNLQDGFSWCVVHIVDSGSDQRFSSIWCLKSNRPFRWFWLWKRWFWLAWFWLRSETEHQNSDPSKGHSMVFPIILCCRIWTTVLYYSISDIHNISPQKLSSLSASWEWNRLLQVLLSLITVNVTSASISSMINLLL